MEIKETKERGSDPNPNDQKKSSPFHDGLLFAELIAECSGTYNTYIVERGKTDRENLSVYIFKPVLV